MVSQVAQAKEKAKASAARAEELATSLEVAQREVSWASSALARTGTVQVRRYRNSSP